MTTSFHSAHLAQRQQAKAKTPPCVGRLKYSEAEVQRLAVDLIEELTSLGHPADAGRVAAAYLSDADNAVLLFAQSRQWREALQTAYRCDSWHSFVTVS